MPELTTDQTAIHDAAQRLLAVLDATVPNTTVHYAVEDARTDAKRLVRLASGVVTNDVKRRMASASLCDQCREAEAEEWGMCGSCIHDAERSGWTPGSGTR